MNFNLDLSQLNKVIDDVEKDIRYKAGMALEECGKLVEDCAKDNLNGRLSTRVNNILYDGYDTGALQDSITQEAIKEDGDKLIKTIYTTQPYAKYVEYGTGKIGSSHPYSLESGAYTQHPWIYFDDRKQRFVWTEGRPAVPFMRKALEDCKDTIELIITEAISK